MPIGRASSLSGFGIATRRDSVSSEETCVVDQVGDDVGHQACRGFVAERGCRDEFLCPTAAGWRFAAAKGHGGVDELVRRNDEHGSVDFDVRRWWATGRGMKSTHLFFLFCVVHLSLARGGAQQDIHSAAGVTSTRLCRDFCCDALCF